MDASLFLNTFSRACVPGVATVIFEIDSGLSMPESVKRIVGIKRNVFLLEKDGLRIKSADSLEDDPGNDPFVWGLGFKLTVQKIDMTIAERTAFVNWIKSIDSKVRFKTYENNRLVFTYAQQVPDIHEAYESTTWWILHPMAKKVDVSQYNKEGYGSRLEQVRAESEQAKQEKEEERQERKEVQEQKVQDTIRAITGGTGGSGTGVRAVTSAVNGAVGGMVLKALVVYFIVQIVQGKKALPFGKKKGKRY